ncbi:hypothetical protein MMC12_000975 [Toensbergia leucococca]|nr:hypothetical protein [Toensbergia leucococca]
MHPVMSRKRKITEIPDNELGSGRTSSINSDAILYDDHDLDAPLRKKPRSTPSKATGKAVRRPRNTPSSSTKSSRKTNKGRKNATAMSYLAGTPMIKKGGSRAKNRSTENVDRSNVFPFLGLPGEVRNKIYEYAFASQDAHINIAQHQSLFYAHNQEESEAPKFICLDLLYLNKQIYAEARHFLYEMFSFYLSLNDRENGVCWSAVKSFFKRLDNSCTPRKLSVFCSFRHIFTTKWSTLCQLLAAHSRISKISIVVVHSYGDDDPTVVEQTEEIIKDNSDFFRDLTPIPTLEYLSLYTVRCFYGYQFPEFQLQHVQHVNRHQYPNFNVRRPPIFIRRRINDSNTHLVTASYHRCIVEQLESQGWSAWTGPKLEAFCPRNRKSRECITDILCRMEGLPLTSKSGLLFISCLSTEFELHSRN